MLIPHLEEWVLQHAVPMRQDATDCSPFILIYDRVRDEKQYDAGLPYYNSSYHLITLQVGFGRGLGEYVTSVTGLYERGGLCTVGEGSQSFVAEQGSAVRESEDGIYLHSKAGKCGVDYGLSYL